MMCDQVLDELRGMANSENAAGMARFGINPECTLGIAVPLLRLAARRIGRDHALARDLWVSGIHEARILASMIDDPARVTPEQMDAWAADFDSWDVCDQACGNLFDRTPYAFDKVAEWSRRDEEYVRRAAFAMLAELAVHDKRAPDDRFIACLPLIVSASTDERNFVKKAVNWSLRQIGKRNLALNARAIEVAHEIQQIDSRSARANQRTCPGAIAACGGKANTVVAIAVDGLGRGTRRGHVGGPRSAGRRSAVARG